MISLLARTPLFLILLFGLAGAPAYEFYASTSHEAVENIAAEWEEAALGDSSSKRLRARRDMHPSPANPPASFGDVNRRSHRLLAVPQSLAWLPDSDISLHHALHIFRI
ncbi:MAG TPA: hypothetical protein VLA17_13735 [Candidatus Limnocylindria bacterium]|nr:hypothetical protein [Candidatus Limnocylindria bacterium]